jgi:hypothetical protein
MQILSGLATLAFVLVGAAVGIRLLVAGRRTRELPELSVGLALLLIGGIGYPLAVLSGLRDVVSPGTGIRLVAISTFVIDAGFVGVVVFTWSVFRRKEAWARLLLAVLATGYFVHAFAVGIVATDMTDPKELMTAPVTLAGQLLNTVCFGWTAIEAYRYWWMLRKRAALGLSDPITTNRFLLWALAGTSSLLTNAISWWVVFTGIDFFEHDGVQISIALLSVASCSCQYLAFLPPKAYLARLRAS